MTIEPTRLDVEDAMELGELLGFIGEWLANDREGLGVSLHRYVGTRTYNVEELENAVRRFEFLIVGGDGSALFGDDEP